MVPTRHAELVSASSFEPVAGIVGAGSAGLPSRRHFAFQDEGEGPKAQGTRNPRSGRHHFSFTSPAPANRIRKRCAHTFFLVPSCLLSKTGFAPRLRTDAVSAGAKGRLASGTWDPSRNRAG